MQNKVVSIIMPAYNCEKFVKQAIDSVLNQTYPYFELLVADDSSTDNTKQILDAYKDERIKKYHNPVNLGYLKTCNLLAEKASGEFFTFLDADDVNTIDRLEKQITFLKNHPQVSCVGCNIYRIDTAGTIFSESDFPTDYKQIVSDFDNYKVTCHYSSLLIKREVIDKIGLYNDYFDRIGSEDMYWFTLMIEKFQLFNLPEKLYYYRKHPTSITATHKNPKAMVGDVLIRFFYKRRKSGKADYIALKHYKKVDSFASYFLALNKMDHQFYKGSLQFVSTSIKHPFLLSLFVKDFLVKIKLKLKLKSN